MFQSTQMGNIYKSLFIIFVDYDNINENQKNLAPVVNFDDLLDEFKYHIFEIKNYRLSFLSYS